MAWAPDYITTAEFKSDQGIVDTADDTRIARDITRASRAVDLETRRQFGVVTAEVRSYTAHWSDTYERWVVPIDDTMVTPTAVTVSTGTITAFALKPANAALIGRPWTLLVVDKTSTVQPTCDRDGVTMSAPWGWSAVPAAVKAATMDQTARFFKRKDAPFGIAGSPDSGSEIRLLAKLDPDVAVTLKSYVRGDKKRVTG